MKIVNVKKQHNKIIYAVFLANIKIVCFELDSNSSKQKIELLDKLETFDLQKYSGRVWMYKYIKELCG